MLFGKQSAVQKNNRLQGEAERVFILARQQFLRDRVAVIMRDRMRLADAEPLQKRFLDVGVHRAIEYSVRRRQDLGDQLLVISPPAGIAPRAPAR
ncbi:MAG: hypothetical protein R3C42_07280 [Parvularculaceae bacterium]